jgi:hypothetical protein
MSLDLDETASFLTDDVESIYLRAIRLFEFQICLFFPKALSTEKIDNWHANARLLAALKFLEGFEIAAKDNKEAVSLRKLAANSDYAEIFDKIILKTGGSRGIRSVARSDEFDKQIKFRRRQAGVVTKLVDFSYRFACLNIKTRAKGGVTMARSIVSTAPSYKCVRKLSTLKTRWREYGRTAGFLYLLAVQRFELIPCPVTSNKFTKRLLKQANDIEHIREFFQAYQHLCNILNARGYGFPTISSNVGNLSDLLAIDAFSKDVDDAIKNYKSAG